MPLKATTRKRLVSRPLAPLAELGDDRLCDLAREGDGDALDVLLHRYTSYARAKAKTYFLVGADREDIIQEGMIGLYKAIRDYDASKTVSFRSFAELCITRQIITAIKGATRQKHAPLNSYVSIHRSLGGEDDDGERQLVDFLAAARIVDPLEQVVATDEVAEIRQFLADILSDLECEVLELYLEGRSYQEIAGSLRRQSKSIDNALQRIKRKLEIFLQQREELIEEESHMALHLGRFEAASSGGGNGHNGNGHRAGDGQDEGGVANGHGHHANGARARSSARPGDLRASLRFASRTAARRSGKHG